MKVSSRGIGMKGLWLALVLGAGLGGCAVLTVDVDVYKGSLVNEEHVQLHQLTALATAAKPMLIGLRNNLEWPHTGGMPPKGPPPGPQVCSTSDHYWYEQGYVLDPSKPMSDRKAESRRQQPMERHDAEPKPAAVSTGDKQVDPCWKGFENSMARRVNRVLHLYEDLGTKELSYYAKQLLDAQARAHVAQSILEGDDEQDAKRFALITAGLKVSLDDNQKKLKEAYITLLCFKYDENSEAPACSNPSRKSSFRKAGALMDALKAIAPSGERSGQDGKAGTGGKTVERALIDNWEDMKAYREKGKENIYEGRLPFRAVWELLAEAGQDSTLGKATKDLFNTDAKGMDAHKVLTAWVKELTEAYWDAREASHDLWEASLQVVIQLDRLEQTESIQHRAVLDQAIDVAVRLTGLRHIASAVHRVKSNELCAFLNKGLISGMACDSTGGMPQAMWTESAVQADSDRYVVFLRRAFSKAPADTAYFLLDLDRLEQGAAPTSSTGKVPTLVQEINEVSTQHIVRLGLNRSSTDGDAQDDYQRLIQDLSRGLAGGFERGRLFYGIHTLTEKYLEVHDRATDTRNSHNIKSIDEDEHERRLLDALVEFAEKVRFLANHESLASPPVASGLVLGGVDNLARGLLGDNNVISPLINDQLDESKKQRYVRVLQAVGNSILFSANELRERDRYREQGQKKVAAEVTAARSVYSPDPAKVITDLLAELEYDKQGAQTELDEANARKPTVAKQRQTLVDKQDAVTQELDAVKKERADYMSRSAPVDATHQVLSHRVSEVDKSTWKRGWKKLESEPDKFLKDAKVGLNSKLTDIRNSLQPTQEKSDRFGSAISYVGSDAATAAFASYMAAKDKSGKSRADLLWDDFIEHVEALEKERLKQLADYKKKQDAQEGELGRVNEQIAVLTAEAALIANLPGKITQLETAKTEIASVQGSVLRDAEAFKEAKGGIPFVSPETIYSLIRSHLQKKPTDSSQTAQTVLLSRTPPPGMPPPDPNDYKSPREVMDTVIALLRHRQMEAVERYGKGSTQEEKATEAIENAYRHRAGMIYIRPSSAYLRTSFPSTSLQDDPNLAWDNMLLKQGLRNLPFSSELRDILNPSVKQDQVLTSELDKQYWQNINRVRVSGAGATNHALVKDDVGNWYVKQYFGDTERIWESAKNLALFSMSAKVPIDLAKQLNKASSPEELAENSKETPTLQKVLEKHQGAYKTHTDEIKAKLERLHTKNDKSELQETVIAAWEAHGDLKDASSFRGSLLTELKTEIHRWDQAVKDTAGQDPGQAIVKDVRALARLDTLLAASIEKIDATAKLKAAAKDEVHKIVGGQVKDILADRTRTLDQYEQAIVFIGDAANTKETKQSKSNSETANYEDIRK